MAGRSHSVNVGIKADASDAVRELERLGDSVQGIQDTFTTFAGQAKMQMAQFAADAAISLGQQFASQVGERMLDVERWENTIDRVFGENTAIEDWARGLRSSFGVGETSILNQLGLVAEKLDLDGRDPKDLGLIQSFGDIAGAIALYAPQIGGIEEVFENLSNWVATGEAGALEDYFGDLGELGGTAVERFEAMPEAFRDATDAQIEGSLEMQETVNELKAAWDELITGTAQELVALVEFFKPIAEAGVAAFTAVDEKVRDLTGALTGIDGGIGLSDSLVDVTTKLWEMRPTFLGGTGGPFAEHKLEAEGLQAVLVDITTSEYSIAVDTRELDAAYERAVLIRNTLATIAGGIPGGAPGVQPQSPFSPGQVDPDVGYRIAQEKARVEQGRPWLPEPEGSQGLIGDFGMGTSVTLHGREAIIPLNDPMARGALGGHTINVNVSVPVGADQVSTGRAIVEAIEAWQRATGGINYLSGLQSV